MSSHIVIEGNLAADPIAGTADSGTNWARFDVITNDRYPDRDGGGWVAGPGIGYRVAVFRRLAENAAATLRKGTAVIVAGRLTVKSYTDADGNERISREIVADHLGASLAHATARITKNQAGNPAGDDIAGEADELSPF